MPFYRRIANLFRRARLQQEIEAELQAHLEMREEDNRRSGMPPEEARRDALLRFGSAAGIKEDVTAADSAMVFDSFWRDIRYATRQLRRSPGFASISAITVALAIAANVVVFGVLNALVLKPLNVAGGKPVFNVVQKPRGFDNQSWPDYLDYAAQNTTFAGMAAYRIRDVGVRARAAAFKSWDYEVSGNYFDVLGIRPALGRFFHASAEHGANSAPYIVLSDAFWQAHFQADPQAIGATVYLNKQPFTVIGVAPRDFYGTERFLWPDFWIPIIDEQQVDGYNSLDMRFRHNLWIVGLLKPGVSLAQATDDLNAIAHRLAKQYPTTNDGMGARLVKAGLLGDQLSLATQAFLTAIMLLAILVLTAACANLASIFAARASDRTRELGIRIAIGSSRWHIMRQLLTEAVIVSLAGGVVGTIVAAGLLSGLSRWQPFAELPIHVSVIPDLSVFGLAVLLSLISGVLPGLIPARQVWRTDAIEAMRGYAAGGLRFRRWSARDVLLGIQVTLCALLLTASLVALRGMQSSLHAPLGFQPEQVLLANSNMQMAGYTDNSSLRIQKRMLEEAANLPGVVAAGTINEPPLGTGGSSTPVYREETTDFRGSNSVDAAKFYSISPGYLHAAGTRLLAGRDFTWHDNAKAPKVALVNERFARVMFGDAPALGRRFALSRQSLYQIVGVVEDGKYDSLTEAPRAAMFFPVAQMPDSGITLVVRSRLPAAETAKAIDRLLRDIDASLPFTIRSWPEALALVLFPARAATVSLGVMGLLAALLAVTGVFGISAYSVARRKKEFGIRMALGTRSVQLLRAALGRPLALLICGSTAGLVLGVLSTRLLGQIVYGATPRDPLVWCGVVCIMALLGISATWIPARRALAIDPATLIREEQ